MTFQILKAATMATANTPDVRDRDGRVIPPGECGTKIKDVVT